MATRSTQTQVILSPRTRRLLIGLALPLPVYVAVALIMTWPLVTRLTTHAAGAGYADSYEIIRHGWWIREAILDGQNPFRQTLLAYPEGFTSTLMWAYPLRFGPTALLSFLLPPLVAFNVVVLLTLVLNGLAAYWLGLALNEGRALAALLGGLVFMAFPAMQGHASAGHVEILTLWPLALLALCLWRVLYDAGAGWRTVLAGAVCFALAALGMVSQIIYTLLPLVLFVGLYLLLADRGALVRRGEPLRAQPWARAVAMIALGGVLLLPFFGPLLTAAGRAEVEGLREPGRVTFSTDLLAFVSPSPFGVLGDAAPDYARAAIGGNATEGAAYLGVAAVALAVVAVLTRRAARPWLALALGAMIFSLGPLLKWRDYPVLLRVEDFETYITLPWAFLQDLPVIEATRTPGRFNLATGLALSALVSLGAAVVLRPLRGGAARAVVALVVMAVILAEYQLFWPFLTVDARLPVYFDRLADEDDVRAVFDVPRVFNLVDKLALYEQTAHGKPILAGHISRRTPQDPALLGLAEHAALADEALPPSTVRREDVPYLLSAAGADRVIVHKAFLDDPAPALARLDSILGGATYEDDAIAAYAVPPVPEPPEGFALAVAPGAAGWSDVVSAGGVTGRWLADEGELYLHTPEAQAGVLTFPAAPYRAARGFEVWLDDHLIDAVVVADPEEGVQVPLWLDAGFHTLRLRAMEGCTPYEFDLACLDEPAAGASCGRLEAPTCISAIFGTPTWEPRAELPAPVEALVGDGLSLRAVDLDLTDGRLTARLYWDTERPLAGSYALFVHVADPVSGRPLAQNDAFPAVTTDVWPAGTRWQSQVTVDVSDLPPGPYDINVGWFVPGTPERLGLVTVGTVELGE